MAQKPPARAAVCLVGWCVWGALVLGLAGVGVVRAAEPSRVRMELLNPQGEVEVLRRGQNTWVPAQTNLVLAAGDAVRTGKESRAAVRLSNNSVIRLDQLTMVRFPEPRSPRQRFLVNLVKGAVYFFHRDRPVETDFETPLVSGAIRGTEFNLAVGGDGRTVLTLIDGAVELSNAQGQLALQTGDQAVVEPGRAPVKTAMIEVVNVIQWCLYYPAVIDLDELALGELEQQSLAASLAAYRAGDLPHALGLYPPTRAPASPAETIYVAQLRLAVGQVPEAEGLLKTLPPNDPTVSPLANALQTLIAAVKYDPAAIPDTHHAPRTTPPPSPSALLADSYLAQARARLPEALSLARAAVERSPKFGFGWARVAELEFSFGRRAEALAAIEEALRLSPRNAQALVANGFLRAAQGRPGESVASFDQAIGVDGALGNAWLGRGLCEIRRGHSQSGREDLLVAAGLEPNRALLRSYLGKAYGQVGDRARAAKELELAERLDPSDPTAWLYAALLNQQRSRVNQAVDDLERSLALNDNRQVYRSRLLLDQDRAVRGANLAGVYLDAGMADVGFREAARAANVDYANFSSHLFLANSYNDLRDPRQINLRYETPWLSEFLLANLLAPPGAGALSQAVSEQEYGRLFERNHVGLVSSTEYRGNGDWEQSAAQYGLFDNTAYSAEVFYRSLNGWRPNNDLDQLTLSLQFKQQVTAADSVYLQTVYYHADGGDLRQYYDQNSASPDLRFHETQEPLLLGGWHHEWSPRSHTLFLAGRLQDTFTLSNPAQRVIDQQRDAAGALLNVDQVFLPLQYRNELEIYTTELQHLWQGERLALIAGSRFQIGNFTTENQMPGLVVIPPTQAEFKNDFERASVYGYGHWQPLDQVRFIAGVAYDWLKYPANFRAPPLAGGESSTDRVSPKVGLILTPGRDTTVRAAYTQSLGGVSFDQSFQLEPSQIAGFSQTFRSLIPESVSGALSAQRYETFGAALDQKFPTRTYLGISGELLKADSTQTIGTYDFVFPNSAVPSSTPERLRFAEKSLRVTLNQLVGHEWSFGAQYRLTRADLEDTFTAIPAGTPATGGFMASQHPNATLHQVNLFANYNHPSGFFGQAQAIWSSQSNSGYAPAEPGDEFWQGNLLVGYRLPGRRAELSAGVLNVTDQDYRLNPLTLYPELPRGRTAVVSLRFNF